MNQELRNVVVTFHISFNGDTPFVGSAVCFFKTVSGGELRCRYNRSILFEEILPGGKYLRDSSIKGMIQKERLVNSVFGLLLFAVSLVSVFGILTAPDVYKRQACTFSYLERKSFDRSTMEVEFRTHRSSFLSAGIWRCV